jgi:ABC-type cobalamin/Fe3+-siderophores transport system ATPase subunit
MASVPNNGGLRLPYFSDFQDVFIAAISFRKAFAKAGERCPGIDLVEGLLISVLSVEAGARSCGASLALLGADLTRCEYGEFKVPFDLDIPSTNGLTHVLSVSAGEIIFLLGANGTGKSSLIHRFYTNYQADARRITAHRQTFFEGDGSINLSPDARRTTEQNMRGWDLMESARWSDIQAAVRPGIAIFDLVDAENIRAREIANAVDGDHIELAKELRTTRESPVNIINELLKLSNIQVSISIEENSRVVARKNGSAPYGIAQLSDGERNAVLIAASVLTARPGTLLLIDEPERHLHRSIISPLLSVLFKKRLDCAFVVSTHDFMLPIENPTARTLLIRGCTYQNSAVTAWDADIVAAGSEIEDDLRTDILGARRKLLFVEGEGRSLDKPLYSLIFPDVSVIAKGSCRDVEHAVSSIRGASGLHWLSAFGVVDNDRRPQSEIEALALAGVYATSVFTVESVYYHPELQRRVAERHAVSTGGNVAECIEQANAAVIAAVTEHAQRLSERVAEKRIREEESATAERSGYA